MRSVQRLVTKMIHEINHKGTRNPVIKTDEGKFKWQGEFEALKRFVEEVLGDQRQVDSTWRWFKTAKER